MKIVITGSRGFIGGSFARFAAAAGHDVLGISRSSQPSVHWPGAHLRADTLHADLAPVIREFEPDLFLHAAGSASVGDSLADPLEDLRASAMTLANALEGVRRSGIAPVVIFPSSAAVYGNPATLPVTEEAPVAPISPYGFHKAAGEMLAREYAECFGLRAVVCRLFSVFGPRQHRLLVWEIFQQLAGAAPRVELQGTGGETRDFLHVDDVSTAFLQLAEKAASGLTVVNVASGREISVRDLAERLATGFAAKPVHCRGHTRAGDPMHWRASIDLLGKLAPAWQPRELDAMLRATVSAWQNG